MGDTHKRGVGSRLAVLVVFIGLLVGLLPGRAEAFQPPLAPPVTGLCTTPWGAMACLTVVVIGGLAAIVAADGSPEIGIGPNPDAEGEWCLRTTNSSEGCYEGEITITEAAQAAGFTAGLDWASGDVEGDAGNPNDNPWGLTRANRTVQWFWFPADPEAPEWGDFGIEPHFAIAHPVPESGMYADHGWGGNNLTDLEGLGFRHDFHWTPTGAEPMCAASSNLASENNDANMFHDFPENCVMVSLRFQLGLQGAPGTTNHYMVAPQGDGCGPGTGDQGWLRNNSAGGGALLSSVWWRCVSEAGEAWAAPKTAFFDGIGHLEVAYVNLVKTGNDGLPAQQQFMLVERRGPAEGWDVTITHCRAPDGTIIPRLNQGTEGVTIGENGQLSNMGCEAGEVPVYAEVQVCDTGTFENCVKVAEWTLPQLEDVDFGCLGRLSTADPCPMWVEFWDGTAWTECEVGVSCEQWWTHPQRDILFRCGWGGDYYSASQCVMLQNFYDTEEITVVNPSQPQPDPTHGGQPVQVDAPPPPTTARPTTTWFGNLITQWTTGSLDGVWFDSCWPQGWGLLNPLQWVLRPIMCALTFAFVPQTNLETRLETAAEFAMTREGVGVMLATYEGLGEVGVPAVGSGCGWGIPSMNLGPMTVPEIQLILCPADYGLSGTASQVRSWAHVIVALGALSMGYRWLHLGRAEPVEDDQEIRSL